MSPYLFVLCAQAFSALLHNAEINGSFSGVKVCMGSPSVTHLFFADDSLLAMKANTNEASTLKEIMQLYENCSGQCVNVEKSSIMFSPNTQLTSHDVVKAILHINNTSRSEKYLGLPVYIEQSKKQAFAYLKDKIWTCVQGWREKLLSKAGKEILIKAVAQAIPTYAMSCFYLTKKIVMI